MLTITAVPIEIFLHGILPLLSFRAIQSLGCTNRDFCALTSDETFWHKRLRERFPHHPTSAAAKAAGWKVIYRRMLRPKVYVWG